MRCERAQELFSDYCEGSVHRTLRVPLESHLDGCATCRAQVSDLKELWRTLDAAPVVEPPVEFRAAVWSRIEARQASQRQTRRLFAWPWQLGFSRPALAWAGAAALLLVLGGVVVPGRYVGASLGFPWSLFQRAPVATAGQATVSRGDGLVVDVPLTASSRRTVMVSTPTPGVLVAPGSEMVTVGPGQPAHVQLQVTGQVPSAVALQVSAAGSHEGPDTLAVPLNVR